jgi:hypothetical protein
MTYKDLIKVFRVFAAQHPILKDHFSWGQLSDYQREEYIQKYPAIHFVPIASVIDNTNTNFNFNILIFDLNNEWKDMSFNSNQLDSLSLCHEILNDFYAFFINQTTNYNFYLQNPISFQPFLDKWKESVVGVEAQITIVCEQTACIPPYIAEQYFILFESGDIMESEAGDLIQYEQQ